jgi:hypothetical protein
LILRLVKLIRLLVTTLEDLFLVKIQNILYLANKLFKTPGPAVVPEDDQFEVERVMDDQVVPVGGARR